MTSLDSRIVSCLPKDDQRVTVYIRNYDKKAIVLKLPGRIKLSQIKENIFRKMKIPEEDQALFAHGILLCGNQCIEIQDKQIFHVVNLKRTSLDSIKIYVKRIEPNSPRHQFYVNPSTKINQFFQKQFANTFPDPGSFFLVYTGRQLKGLKTFGEEFIEHQSQLLAIHKVENLKDKTVVQRDKKTKQQNVRNHDPSKIQGHVLDQKDYKLDSQEQIMPELKEERQEPLKIKNCQQSHHPADVVAEKKLPDDSVGNSLEQRRKICQKIKVQESTQRNVTREQVPALTEQNLQLTAKEVKIAFSLPKITFLQQYEKKIQQIQREHEKKQKEQQYLDQNLPIEITDLKQRQTKIRQQEYSFIQFNLFSPHKPIQLSSKKKQENNQAIQLELAYSENPFSNSQRYDSNPQTSNKKSNLDRQLLKNEEEEDDYKGLRRKMEQKEEKPGCRSQE